MTLPSETAVLLVEHHLPHEDYNKMKEKFSRGFTTDLSDTTAQVEFLREAHGIVDGLKMRLKRFCPLDHRYSELVHILDVFQGIAEEKMTDSFPQ